MTNPADRIEPIEALTEEAIPTEYTSPDFHPLVPSPDGVIRILPYIEGNDTPRE